MSTWEYIGLGYLVFAVFGITFCLSNLALYGYRQARRRVYRWRIQRMR